MRKHMISFVTDPRKILARTNISLTSLGIGLSTGTSFCSDSSSSVDSNSSEFQYSSSEA